MSHRSSTATTAIARRDKSILLPLWTALFVVAVMIPAISAQAQDRPGSFADLVDDLSPTVVNVSTVQTVTTRGMTGFPPGSPFQEFFDEFFGGQQPDGQPQTRRLQSLGSGFVIDPDGLIVTNNHVVRGADEVTVRTVDGKEYAAEVIGRDPEVDLALIRVEVDEPLPAVEWGDSDHARVGDWVLTIGNPFGLGGSVTAGIISAHHRDFSGPYDDFIQTDASINRGNSGGPMFNLDGKVIGVNTAIVSPTGGNVGIGFAIPSNQAQKIIAQLKEYGYARRGFLGVTIRQVTEMDAEALGLDSAEGALVNSVTAGSPADQAGIRAGDIILEFGDEKIETSDELVRLVGDFGVGEEAEVTLLRDGEPVTVLIVTAEKPRQEEDESGPTGPFGAEALGVNFADITPLIRRQFQIPEEINGVIVLDVSVELRGRLLRGDVVTEFDQKPVTSVAQITSMIETLRAAGRSAVMLRIFRNGDLFYVAIPLEGQG